MRDYEAIGFMLLNCTSISSITSNIYHGLTPKGLDFPVITYFQMSGGGLRNGISSKIFSITARAETASETRNLGDEIVELFGGTSGTGIYGTSSSFSIARCSVVRDGGLIPDPSAGCFASPIDVRLVFTESDDS